MKNMYDQPPSGRQPGDKPVIGPGILQFFLLLSLVMVTITSNASKFTCLQPKAGGIFTISLKSATDKCEGIKVNIPAGSTPAQKAALIAAKINASCAGVFSATSAGAEVEVLNSVHPGQRVFFKFGPDATGEKDEIEKSLQPGAWDSFWGATAPLYTCTGSASGISVDGTTPGMIHIGTSTHIATVETYPGQSAYDILNDARLQLISGGVQNVILAEVLTGVWGLSFSVLASDTLVQFGDDDTGTECIFEMFEPPTPVFHQLHFDFSGTITPNSEWGVVDLQFIGIEQIMYLNLTLDTAWVIENMPILSTRGFGLEQVQRYWFDIGDAGVPVSALMYGLTLTPTISGKPLLSATALVTPDFVHIHSGFTGGPPGGGGPGPAGKQKGGQAVLPNPKMHQNFPNQQSPPNYCVPAGVSNSLQWLNSKNNLGMNPNAISIPTLATAFGTNPANGTPRNTIYENKKNHCKKNKLPITTRKFSGSRIADVAKEIKNGQDVELMVTWIGQGGKGHCVAVTGITDHGNGKYSLVITHDKDQNDNTQGTVDENATYDKDAKKWGGALSNASGQSNDIMYLVECPAVKSKQSSNHLPGGTHHRFVQDARVSYGEGQYQIESFELSGYDNTEPPPPLGGTSIFTVAGNATFGMSIDSGMTFTPFSGNVNMMFRVHHTLDSGSIEYYSTEILFMQVAGGSMPPGLIIREKQLPADSSTGLMTMKTVPGGFQISSFIDLFSEMSMDGGVTWLADDNETTVLYAHGPAVLSDLVLQNVFIEEPVSNCYDATNSIITGGLSGGPFMVFPGGEATLIAGQSIVMQHGTSVFPGGYLHAWITENGMYCPDPPVPPMTLPLNADEGDDSLFSEESGHVRVYPNPAQDEFTVRLSGSGSDVIGVIEVLDSKGNSVVLKQSVRSRQHTLNTVGWTPGLYIVKVVSSEFSETVKLVKL